MFQQRTLIAIAAVLCLTLGAYLWWSNDGDNNSLSGILVRVGFMLSATWLALPSLVKPENQYSIYVIAGMLGLLLLVAARPNIFKVVMVIGAITFAANWIMRRVSAGVK